MTIAASLPVLRPITSIAASDTFLTPNLVTTAAFDESGKIRAIIKWKDRPSRTGPSTNF